ncbi:hypothetical protein M23134_07594 [Microscilla marina ATCC 23134]|uniref:Uncharacterized protein n=1 Tax=Microscilla marina ATCC 23134 TaxID=313606 RepID=A1ZF82_MICM2|nr:hypothetical protein M23134_07594 [Microscilla marina ATCC 23134]
MVIDGHGNWRKVFRVEFIQKNRYNDLKLRLISAISRKRRQEVGETTEMSKAMPDTLLSKQYAL